MIQTQSGARGQRSEGVHLTHLEWQKDRMVEAVALSALEELEAANVLQTSLSGRLHDDVCVEHGEYPRETRSMETARGRVG